AWLSSTIVAARWLAGPRGHMPEIYFEAGAAIVAFVMIGKLLESRARARIGEAVRGLMSLAPARARVVADGGEREVEAAALQAGDVIGVRPGERLAADGTIVEGESALDESMLTGESLPVDKTEGSPVYAGTLNHHGALRVRVARAGGDTALARIARAVEDAQGSKAPIARLADRVSAYFVPAVLAIALATGAAWMIAGASFSEALARTIAVLVIACPCALGLATPAAVAVGTARGAQLGVLFQGGGALETASHVDVVCLDKTGTLTAGKPVLVHFEGADDALRLAASAEQASEHPIARAIVDGARARGLALSPAERARIEPGGGIAARVDGHDVRVGTREFAEQLGRQDAMHATTDAKAIFETDRLASVSAASASWRPISSESFVSIDGVVGGAVYVADPPHEDAKAVLGKLRELGVEPVMITGDREAAARAVAGELGIERVHAEVRPTGKAAIVEAEKQGGRRVAMVGDGINDAPALAAADLGVALGSGADVAAAAADVTLLRGGIAALPTALGLARATMRTIRRNLAAAFAYNLVCIPVAAAGLLSPVLASAAMSLSSVSVLLSSLRLRGFLR
ncbi:MAG: heavy metal translocating P-type ATPase, partial [Acidobacteriota bacterium]